MQIYLSTSAAIRRTLSHSQPPRQKPTSHASQKLIFFRHSPVIFIRANKSAPKPFPSGGNISLFRELSTRAQQTYQREILPLGPPKNTEYRTLPADTSLVSPHRMPNNRPPKPRLLPTGVILVLTALPSITQAASTVPSGGAFTSGAGNISAAGSTLTINQSTLRGIIDWTNFSVGKGGLVTFNNGSGATLNRVTGGLPSAILGQLLASGSVYVLNPQGVLIG